MEKHMNASEVEELFRACQMRECGLDTTWYFLVWPKDCRGINYLRFGGVWPGMGEAVRQGLLSRLYLSSELNMALTAAQDFGVGTHVVLLKRRLVSSVSEIGPEVALWLQDERVDRLLCEYAVSGSLCTSSLTLVDQQERNKCFEHRAYLLIPEMSGKQCPVCRIAGAVKYVKVVQDGLFSL